MSKPGEIFSRGSSAENVARGREMRRASLDVEAASFHASPMIVPSRLSQRYLAPVVLALLTLISYWPVLTHGGFIWDDNDYVTQNLNLRSASGLLHIWSNPAATRHQYYPLVDTTFWVEYHLWGLWPQGYHLVNVGVHICNALLLWRVLRRFAVPGSWVVAAVFAVHPVHAETVAWITERKNVLCGLLYLISGWMFVTARPELFGVRDDGRRRRDVFYLISLMCFVSALLSKTVTCTLPAALVIVSWWKSGRVSRKLILLLLPYVAVGAAFAAATVLLERSQIGAAGKDWSLSFAERVLIAGRAFWFYPGKLLWPYPLVFSYPKWRVDVDSGLQWLYPAAILALVMLVFFLRNKLRRGPLAAILFYAVTILPALGFVNVYPMRYTFVADHYQYLASIGLIALAVAAIAEWQRHFRFAAMNYLFAVILPVFCWLTWQRCEALSSPLALWQDTLAHNPASLLAHNNLGNLLSEEHRYSEAIEHYRQVIALAPDDPEAHYNLALCLDAQGLTDEALAELQAAVRVNESDYESHYNIGLIMEKRGRFADAISSYERALAQRPRFVPARLRLANVLAVTGACDRALVEYQRVLEAEPVNKIARDAIATLRL